MEIEQDKEQILKENQRRQRRLNRGFDPISGRGAIGDPQLEREEEPFQRFALDLDEETRAWLLPDTMRGEAVVEAALEAGSLAAMAEDVGISFREAKAALKELRYDHDFSFWAAVCIQIETKTEGHQPFILRRPQRELVRSFERQRLAGEPIRLVLLKARQWGGSTAMQLYMMWIQQRHKKHWNSFVCAQDKGAAKRIRGMYTLAADKYPADVGAVTHRPYEGSQNTRYVEERECIMGVGSVERPDAVRSYTYQMLHLSEVGLWKSAAQVNAESFAQSLSGALVDAPYTFCVIESTAKGVGNFFHRMWQKANGELEKERAGGSDGAAGGFGPEESFRPAEGAPAEDPDDAGGYEPFFVAWFDNEENQAELPTTPERYLDTLDEYEWGVLWHEGASLQQIEWYRRRQQEPGMDEEWRRKSEYPSTPDEAFQSSGSRFYPKPYVKKARKHTCPPAEIGNLVADGEKGEDALTGIEFIPGARGFLQVWQRPGESDGDLEREGYRYPRRYAAFADVGGTTDQADYSTVKVIDRLPMIWHGVPETVAVWHGHLDQDLFAWEAARLARWYDDALLAVEVNSLRRDHGDETRGFDSDHSYTVLHAIRDYYDNLFYRTDPDKDADARRKLGFHTNQQSKMLMLNAHKGAMRDEEYIERDARACDEFDYLERKERGSYGAVEGQHDDRVISTAGAVWLALEYMEPCREVPIKRKRRKRRGGAAEFA
jgi:hypothetical protein